MNYIKTGRAFDRPIAGSTKPMATALMTLFLVTTWCLLHRYKGVVLDGELYAFQALARLNPALRSDVYLMANSQDEFTLFSPLYALFIRWLGLWYASVALFAACTVTFTVGVWSIARSLWDEECAWRCVLTVMVIVCGYGAYGIFTYSENALTARSMAEAMVVAALACHLRGWHWRSWIVSAAAVLVHPLMGLPGLLLLVCLTVPLMYALIGALAGVVAALALTWIAIHTTGSSHFLAVMGGSWLEVVRERSQFIFLQHWRPADWGAHVRPALCLTVAALITDQPKIKRLCICAMIVGATGLAVAAVASNLGPVALLLQGQAWRWFWVTGFICILTLAPTAFRLWSKDGCGSICATLLVASWTFPPADGNYLAAAALGLLFVGRYVQPPTQKLLRWLSYVMITAIFAWLAADIWSICTSPSAVSTGDPALLERVRNIYALQIPALIVGALGLRWLCTELSLYTSVTAAVLLIAVCFVTISSSFRHDSVIGTAKGMDSVSDWINAIPSTSNVLVLPSQKAASFIWFTLQRPSYLTVDQSSGVVFSPETASEIRRRADVLLPVMEPDWKIMTRLNRAATGEKKHNDDEQTQPLTAERLSAICVDSQLGFVIAKERLNFDPVQNSKPGQWKDWNLYSCDRVRRGATT